MLTVSDVRYTDVGSYYCCLPSNCSGNIQDNCQQFVLSSSITAISLFLSDYYKRNIGTWMKRKVSPTAIVLVDAQRWNIHELNKIWYTIYIEYFMECAYAIFAQSCWRIRNRLSERSPDWLQLIWVWRIATAFQWVYLSMSKIWCNGTRITWFKSLIKW